MNSTKIAITAFSSLSPLGNNPESVWKKYLDNQHCFSTQFLDQQETSVAALDAESKEIVAKLRESDAKYKFLDDSVLFALAASRKAVQDAGWKEDAVFGINIGSSRGATDLFEKHYKEYLDTGKAQTLASPTTTLGNISSWIAHDLQSTGPEISHSITCSTALHALLNGVAWLKSGMADKFLVGGSEAPLTDFTIAQMRALKIYSRLDQAKDLWPNLAFDFEKTQNTMILGEGAAVCCLEAGEKENAIAYISGVGYATEILEHNISISAEATCFQKSMKMALKDESPENIDVIVMHAPGTIKGDLTELRAIEKVFGAHLPLLTTNKWKIGHTFGASGMLSLELALLMMEHNKFVDVPFTKAQKQHKEIKKILINAVGFGGNAVSVLVEKA
ncbi:beta-ketoacyl synthase N-terminal-like domain-containing protein [Flavobacterium sp. Fl-77]|uniref:Beta-ketoacyl synthase N-terminal-like domain-containing protein n=1 Tax=Flavobacterium flavipigmentatum TaxID=2893884 RepID=A0AAJ2S6F4_9FLAO|nr:MULTISPECIES: beta-ketoacyl synthase N-terminal-like domain-containing protein [unclassified Flavobacterium]MDX6180812.1 beta-ketoacyl synthase N-terminal-like domain-containing protein [Flavobacterium sp. Fl-33]MDX6184412.1 beta-ketoacyl synthase N-terminal-like domain-containing protein [Flavobacterium sp. Fl-77]UFH39521.1 beta-ketoacyl synthase [Flavobacterium sp. F-70]